MRILQSKVFGKLPGTQHAINLLFHYYYCFHYYCCHDDNKFHLVYHFFTFQSFLTNMPRAQIVTLLSRFYLPHFRTSFLITLYIAFDMNHLQEKYPALQQPALLSLQPPRYYNDLPNVIIACLYLRFTSLIFGDFFPLRISIPLLSHTPFLKI